MLFEVWVVLFFLLLSFISIITAAVSQRTRREVCYHLISSTDPQMLVGGQALESPAACACRSSRCSSRDRRSRTEERALRNERKSDAVSRGKKEKCVTFGKSSDSVDRKIEQNEAISSPSLKKLIVPDAKLVKKVERSLSQQQCEQPAVIHPHQSVLSPKKSCSPIRSMMQPANMTRTVISPVISPVNLGVDRSVGSLSSLDDSKGLKFERVFGRWKRIESRTMREVDQSRTDQSHGQESRLLRPSDRDFAPPPQVIYEMEERIHAIANRIYDCNIEDFNTADCTLSANNEMKEHFAGTSSPEKCNSPATANTFTMRRGSSLTDPRTTSEENLFDESPPSDFNFTESCTTIVSMPSITEVEEIEEDVYLESGDVNPQGPYSSPHKAGNMNRTYPSGKPCSLLQSSPNLSMMQSFKRTPESNFASEADGLPQPKYCDNRQTQNYRGTPSGDGRSSDNSPASGYAQGTNNQRRQRNTESISHVFYDDCGSSNSSNITVIEGRDNDYEASHNELYSDPTNNVVSSIASIAPRSV